MLVVEIDTRRHNYLLVGEEPFFLLRLAGDRILVTRDRCPHRGGPLHLGQWDGRTGSLTCPWHGTCLTGPALESRSVPAVRRGHAVTAVFDCASDTGVERANRLVIANDNRG